jgi:hypothetical protein
MVLNISRKHNRIINLALSAAIATIGVATDLNAQTNHGNIRYVPEYEKTLEKVIMHTTPNIQIQLETIKNLPEYSKVSLLTEKKSSPEIKQKIKNLKKGTNIEVISYNKKYVMQNRWAQDMFKTITESDSSNIQTDEIILPQFYRYNIKSMRPDSTKAILEREGFITQNAKVYFEGGNIAYDRWNNRNILFVGYSNIENPAPTHKLSNIIKGYPEDSIRDRFKRGFHADTVVFLGKDQGYTTMFHLDQSFIITAPGEVVLLSPEDIKFEDVEETIRTIGDENRKIRFEDFEGLADEEVLYLWNNEDVASQVQIYQSIFSTVKILKDMKKTFQDLGYTVHKYPISLWQNLHYQSYTNSVIFKDKNTGEKRMLLPIFPDIKGNYDTNYSLNHQAIEYFSNLGFKVTPVENHTWASGGNIHCIINACK